MSDGSDASSAVSTGRLLAASAGRVFAAFEEPELLARWWGPKGFTNTFELFEFKPGGRWVFVMHGPGGVSYPNESVFREIEQGRKIVIEHVVKPWFRLTVTLTAQAGHVGSEQAPLQQTPEQTFPERTHLAWVQEFESPQFAATMRGLCETANEEVLDRLEAVLAGMNERL